MKRTIYLASDHGGFDLKEELKQYLSDKNIDFVDVGPSAKDPNDDYPDYALQLVRKMRADDYGVGVAICRSAQGMCMAINRNPGMRAGLVWNIEEAKKSRQHEDANVACLSADYVSNEENIALLQAFLDEEYVGQEQPRHARRLDKLESYFPL